MMSYDPYFFLTESEVIKSEVVLGKVITNLDLNVEFTKRYGIPYKTADSIMVVKAHMDLKGVRNTSLVDVSFLDEKPTQAARVANAIAEAYREHRFEQKQEMRGIATLEKELVGRTKIDD
jgi:uncharacterized protein involved in exopolysaccharide biosynthesis